MNTKWITQVCAAALSAAVIGSMTYPSFAQTAGELSAQPAQAALLRPFTRFWSRLTGAMFIRTAEAGAGPTAVAVRALRLADAIADLEYAITTHTRFTRWFAAWLAFHLMTSVMLYVLLGLHVWSGIHFGLRWFE